MSVRRVFGAALLVGLFAVLVGVGLLFSGVFGAVGDVQGPVRGAATVAPPTPPSSVILVPIDIPLDTLRASVEQQVPTVLMDDEGEPLKGSLVADWSVVREGDVGASMDRGALLLSMPLRVKVKAYPAKRAAQRARRGKDTPSGATLRAAMELRIRLPLSVGDDWHLVTEPTVSHRWLETPKLKVGPLSFDVTRKVDRALEERLTESAEKIRAQIAAQDRIVTRIRAVWESFSEPRALPGGAWLRLMPEALFLGPFRVTDAAMHLEAGARLRIETLLGDEPAPGPARPLPPPTPPPAAQGFSMHSAIHLPWEELTALARERSVGEGIEGAAGTIRIRGIELYPSEDRIAVGVDWTLTTLLGETQGTVWLLGRPELDRAARQVRVVDVDYRVDSLGSQLANDERLRQRLSEHLAERLVFNWGERVDEKLALVNQAGPREVERGTLKLELASAEIAHLALTDEALVLHAALQGRGTLRMTKLEPPTP